MNLIKVKFLKNETPTGRTYTYYSPVEVAVGDKVQINDAAVGIVTETDVPMAEVKGFEDKLKSIKRIVKEGDNA